MSGRQGGGAGAVEGGGGGGEHAAYQLDACERRDVCSAQISNVLISSSSSRKPWRPGPDHNSDQTRQRGRQGGRGRAGRVTVRARDQPRPALSSFFPMKTAKHCCLLLLLLHIADEAQWQRQRRQQQQLLTCGGHYVAAPLGPATASSTTATTSRWTIDDGCCSGR